MNGVFHTFFFLEVVPLYWVHKIIQIPLRQGDDLPVWVHDTSGGFTVRSAWELVRKRRNIGLTFSFCGV